mmetsp:Transcript_44555/g.117743  ORF Transcript_44555/g.117743 Transcript_44555/m.117743 type:complete len:451 (-) Transcript_44555:776-2128(-)
MDTPQPKGRAWMPWLSCCLPRAFRPEGSRSSGLRLFRGSARPVSPAGTLRGPGLLIRRAFVRALARGLPGLSRSRGGRRRCSVALLALLDLGLPPRSRLPSGFGLDLVRPGRSGVSRPSPFFAFPRALALPLLLSLRRGALLHPLRPTAVPGGGRPGGPLAALATGLARVPASVGGPRAVVGPLAPAFPVLAALLPFTFLLFALSFFLFAFLFVLALAVALAAVLALAAALRPPPFALAVALAALQDARGKGHHRRGQRGPVFVRALPEEREVALLLLQLGVAFRLGDLAHAAGDLDDLLPGVLPELVLVPNVNHAVLTLEVHVVLLLGARQRIHLPEVPVWGGASLHEVPLHKVALRELALLALALALLSLALHWSALGHALGRLLPAVTVECRRIIARIVTTAFIAFSVVALPWNRRAVPRPHGLLSLPGIRLHPWRHHAFAHRPHGR